MQRRHQASGYVVCTHNEGCDDLDRLKIYRTIPDEPAAGQGFLRVIDDSGEDYLYPASYFVSIELSSEAEEALRIAS